ncbi:MAG TPA: hypothetical protein VN713_02985 [Sphingomicrobium sp.]|jgi:hypothetical protein|nr:hypothetical protein [Sphingomicrobium sp.]
MALHTLALALSALASTSQPPPYPPASTAPPGTPDALYCLRVDPLIGSHIQTIQCKTRDEWAMLGLDVDQEWAENGVKVIDRIAVTG